MMFRPGGPEVEGGGEGGREGCSRPSLAETLWRKSGQHGKGLGVAARGRIGPRFSMAEAI